jgi:Ca2+-binding RTX toxin-like protein
MKIRRKRKSTIQSACVRALTEQLESRILFSGSYPLSAVPVLNSLPNAPVQLYLDFNGAPAFNWEGAQVPATPAFDQDGDPTTFTAGELSSIQQVWAQVAEAYSPFDVNVTTVDPEPVTHNYALDREMRVIIGGDGSWFGQSEGGTSYTGAFASFLLPRTSFIFTDVLGTTPSSVAIATAHEMGHEFGLNHHSVYSGTTNVQEYETGNSLEGPIMGDPIGDQRAIWWYGPDDTGYNNIQDDMAIISGSANGFGYRPLTVGQTMGTATPLTITSGTPSAAGVIDTTSQTDFYSFTTSGGSVNLNVNVEQYGPTLHAQELIENSSGAIVASADNANTLGQSITTNLSAGNYYLVVESYGQYGDVGQYTVNGTVPTGAVQPSATIAGASSVNEGSPYTLNLSANDPGQSITNWTINWGDGNTQTVSGNPSSAAHTYAVGPNNYSITASITDGNGTYNASSPQSVTVNHVPPTLTISGNSSVNEQAAYTLNLSESDPNHTVSGWSINWGDGSTQTISGTPSTVTHTFATGPATETISATATDNVGTYSANSLNVTVNHVPPTLVISGAASVNEQSVYTLNLSAADGTHVVTGWTINWGDGSTQTVNADPPSETHTYSRGPATETITATATDNVGTYSANSLNVTVNHVAPVPVISGSSTVNEGSVYTLNLSASDPGHTIQGWGINWGDGTIQTINGNPSSITHTYLHGPATETISANVTDDVSSYYASNISVNVAHVPPTLAISGATSVNERTIYTLNLSATDPNHTVSGWSINWGDGNTQTINGNPNSATHIYASGPATDTISAMATDDVGTYASNSKVLSIDHIPPTLAISGNSSVNEAASYTLNLSESDPNHTVSGWNITWGDGSTQTITGTPGSVTHTYATGPATETISASATDDVETYPANSLSVTVNHVPPTLVISGGSSVNEQSVYTLNLSGTDGSHAISGWTIHWGDGATQTITGNPSSATHTYSHGPATETITATATDNVGTYSANSLNVTVNHVAPVPVISGLSTVNESSIYTLNLSVSDPGHTVQGWGINWGDGNIQIVSGTPASITHTYLHGPATETISANITDDVSSYYASNITVNVAHVAPVLAISGASSVNELATYTLNLSASDPNHTISDWVINWGDGSAAQTVSGSPSGVTHVFATGPATDTISATATDDVGTYSANSSTVTVRHVPPVASISGNSSVNGGVSYVLNLAASDPGHTITQWLLNWGDGATQTISGNPSSVSHIYANANANETISATITDDVGTYGVNPVSVAVAKVPAVGDPDTIIQDNSGVVHITGSLQADMISAQTDPNDANSYDFIIITPGIGTFEQTFLKTSITGVVVNTDPASGTPSASNNDIVNFGGLIFNGTTIINAGTGNDTVIGANSPNNVTGGTGNDVLYGGIANDTIHGGVGADIIHGGAGDDVLVAGTESSVLQGGAGNDQITGGAGNDTIRGGPGDDTLTAGSGNAVVMANDGNDSILGGAGNDSLIAGTGNDTINAGTGTGSDFIGGNDLGFLSLQGATVPANTGNDSIIGNNGNDAFSALNGFDTIVAGSGSNYFAINDPNAVIENYTSGGIAENDNFTGAPTETIDFTLTINYVAGGVTTPIVIPMGAGATPTGNSPAEATSNTGNIQFQWNAPRTFVLGDFFDHWGVNLTPTGVGQFQTGGFGHTFAMTVNGVTNTQFANYQVQNGDNIVLTWTQ